jgi:hypothetical protein
MLSLNPTQCLESNTITELVCGTLDGGRHRRALAHLDACGTCRQLVALAAQTADRAGDEIPSPLRPGQRFGRYVVIEILGAGAMGIVYSALDEELARKAALKVVRAVGQEASGPSREVRLLREAKAAAALSHPNVVVIYEVGELGGRPFIAMELVNGGTLRHWLAAAPRTPREILAMFAQVGRGLAAAHDAGIVHRDFKPDNVLVGKDGRPRVADFGVARQSNVTTEDPPNGKPPLESVAVTQSGTAVGTVAYMSPELLRGHEADIRSDQFAFAVSLHEALYGRRPFRHHRSRRTTDSGERSEQVAASRARVPLGARRALQRAMSEEPGRRFPHMHAFVDALEVAIDGRSPRRLALGGLLALLVGAAVLVPWLAVRAQRAPRRSGIETDPGAVVVAAPASAQAGRAYPDKDAPPEIVLQLDASLGIARSSAGVLAWKDQSGHGNDAVARSRPPSYRAHAIRTLPALHFEDGSYLAIDDNPSLRFGTEDFAILVVGRHDRPSAQALGVGYGLTTGYGMLYGKTRVEGPYEGVGLFVNFPAETPTTRFGAQTSYWHGVSSSTEGLNDNRVHIFGARRVGSMLEVRVDGRTEARIHTANDDVSAVGRPAFIGGHPIERGVIQQLRGDIAEIVLAQGVSDAYLAHIEAQLVAKYGIE